MSDNAAALSRIMLAERASLVRRLESIVRSPGDAEEVAQTLWFKLQHVADHPPILRKRAFLFRLAQNLALDHRRAEDRKAALHDAAAALLSERDEAPGPDRIVDSIIVLRRVKEAAEALPEPTRTIFRLNRFEGQSQSAIARQLGVSTTTVENHIRRALNRLAQARDGSLEGEMAHG